MSKSLFELYERLESGEGTSEDLSILRNELKVRARTGMMDLFTYNKLLKYGEKLYEQDT